MANLNYISTARMVRISGGWLDPAGMRPKIEALPAGEALVGMIEKAHGGLLDRQTSDGDAAKLVLAIQDKQATVDVRHDKKYRGGWYTLTGFAELAEDPAEAEAILALRDTLYPSGLDGVRASYEDEAGTVLLVEAKISTEQKALLKKLPIPGGKLWDAVQAGWEAGRELGRLQDEKRRITTEASGNAVSKQDAFKARNQWIKVARHLESALELDDGLSEADREAILAPLRDAERVADKLAAKAATGGAAEDVVEPAAPEAPAAKPAAPAKEEAKAPAPQ